MKLGWWGLSKQAGTAIARHPAFGDFPHDGYLNELWFRIVDATIPAGRPALKSVEPLMVGDGSLGYLIYVFQAKAGKGKLLASGLDLLGDKPEAACLLDQFLNYVQSDQFQPAGTLDLQQAKADWELWTALAKQINGWARTTKTFRRVAYPSYLGPAADVRCSAVGHGEAGGLDHAACSRGPRPGEELHLPLVRGPGMAGGAAGQVHAWRWASGRSWISTWSTGTPPGPVPTGRCG